MNAGDKGVRSMRNAPGLGSAGVTTASFVDAVVAMRTPETGQPEWMQQADMKDIANCIVDAILVADHRGRLLNCNSEACRLFGYSMEQIAQLRLANLVSGLDESELADLFQNLQSDKPRPLMDASCIRADGKRFPGEIAAHLVKRKPPQLCLFLRDITQRHRVEARLRTEHNALKNARDGIVITNEEAMIEYVNSAFAALWGYDRPGDLDGKDLRSMLAPVSPSAPPEQQPLLWWSLIVDHESWSEELLAIRRDGSNVHVLANAACNRDAEGRVIGMVLSFTDLTDRNRAEEALRQSERQRAMLASVGAACHHLGQPATVLAANLELIKRLTEDRRSPELARILEQSRTAVEQMTEILFKLNTVTEFKTVPYLEQEDRSSPENSILDI